ncbi:MAG: PepSY domain-containing protein, partial [Limisphaerales bacterium]
LGIPVPGRNADKNADVAVEVDSNKNHVTTEVDGGLDTDKNDGRILGVPKRGFETISLSEVPPVVRETIRREAGGYKVAEIEKAILNGRQVYEVDIERDGKNRELHVATDGTIIKDTDREAVGAPRNNRTRPEPQGLNLTNAAQHRAVCLFIAAFERERHFYFTQGTCFKTAKRF